MNQMKSVNKGVIKHFSTYGLALFLFLTPFEYPLADLMAVSPLRLVGLFAMGLAILDILLQGPIKFDYRFLYIAIWLLYGLITWLWAIDELRFQSYYSIYANNALMFLLFSVVSFTEREVDILKKSMIGGVGALLVYMTFLPGAVVYSDYQHRLTLNAGTEGLDQNYLAALMLISFGLVFYNLCVGNGKKVSKLLSAFFCLAIAYYVLLTGSRSGLIAIALIVLLSINTSWKTRLLIGVPILVFLLFVLPVLSEYLPEDLLERFSLQALIGQEEESGTRFLIWEKAIDSLKGIEVLFGYGGGASQTVVGDVLGRGDAAIHNHYMALMVEFGLIGFLLFNIPVLKMNMAVLKKDKVMAISFSGISLMAFFLDVITTKFFWAAMILLSCCYSAAKTNKTKMSN